MSHKESEQKSRHLYCLSADFYICSYRVSFQTQ